MKFTIPVFCMMLALGPGRAPEQSEPAAPSPCAMVERALAVYYTIKPGVLRRDVEKNFSLDGGLEFSGHAWYIYRGCEYIKLEVDFQAGPERGKAFHSPDDSVVKVSKLYIDYPTRD